MYRWLLFVIFLFPASVNAHPPLPLWRWSEIRFSFDRKSDSTLVIDSYKRAWLNHGISDTSAFHDGNYGVYSFERFRLLDKKERSEVFDPEFIRKVNFTGQMELITAWSPPLDSFMVYSYEPLCAERVVVDPMGNIYNDTSAFVHCPFRTYRDFMPATRYNLISAQLQQDLAEMMGGTLSHDTILRVVRFTCDSNEYLPQASYKALGLELSALFYNRTVTCYGDRYCTIELDRQEYDRVGSKWDSTNYVADPNTPNNWIMAPIKYMIPSRSVLIFEQWIPDTIALPVLEMSHNVKPCVRYTRRVISYGQLTEQGVAWGKAELIDHEFKKNEWLDWSAYQQCFKAERFIRSGVGDGW